MQADRSNSLLTKTIEKENAKDNLKKRSVDTVKQTPEEK